MATEKRLIDANAWIESHCDGCDARDKGLCYPMEDPVCGAVEVMNEQPTIDAVEVVHGRWEWYADRCEDLFLGCDEDYGWRCSHCRTPLEDCDDPEVPPTFNYCRNCGAKMDGDVNE